MGQSVRQGELIAGVSGFLLIVFSFLTWFEPNASDAQLQAAEAIGLDTGGASAWKVFELTDLLLFVLGLAGIALLVVAAMNLSTALPVAASVIATPLAAVIGLIVVYRTLLNQPGPNDAIKLGVGAYLGVVAVIGVFVGSFLSLQDESAPGSREVPVTTQPTP